MGNRAVITFAPYDEDDVGLYVHWSGDRPSIEGFLLAAKRMDFRTPGEDPPYAMARLTQVITTFFKGGLSVGVGVVRSLDTDNGANGVYVIGSGWEIVERKFARDEEGEDPARAEAVADAILKTLQPAVPV
jgi:hypothetical protein